MKLKVVWFLSTAIASMASAVEKQQVEAKFMYAEEGLAAFQTEAGDHVVSPIEVGSFTERYLQNPGFLEGKSYTLTYQDGTWMQESMGTREVINVQRLTDAQPSSTANKLSVAPEQLVGMWETANVDRPYDENNPALTLRFSEDGTLTTDGDTNRERRGSWKLKGEIILEDFSGKRYSNRIVEFNSTSGTMTLKYELYGNKELRLQQLGRFD